MCFLYLCTRKVEQVKPIAELSNKPYFWLMVKQVIALSSMFVANSDLDGGTIAIYEHSETAIKGAEKALNAELENGIDGKVVERPSDTDIQEFLNGQKTWLEWSVSYDEAEQGKYIVVLRRHTVCEE